MTSNSSRLRPEPTATQVSGDSASCTGICVSSQALLEAGQEGAAARQDDAAIHDVRGQLGRGLVQGRLDGVEDLADRLVEGAADLLGGDHDRLGEAGEHVAAAYLGLDLLLELPGRADLELELLRGLLPDQELAPS